MAENTAIIKKPFTVKDAHQEDIDYIKNKQLYDSVTVGGALHLVILEAKQAKNQDTPVNTEETVKLADLNNSLLAEIAELKEKLSNTASNIPETHVVIDKESLRLLSEERVILSEKLIEAEDQVKQLTEKVQGQEAANFTLSGTQFICSPTDELAIKIRKARPFLKKDKVIIGSDYPGELATKAIEIFLNEDYSHIF